MDPSHRHLIDVFKPVAEGRAKGSIGRAQRKADIFKNTDLLRAGLFADAQKVVGHMSARKPATLAQAQVLLLRDNSKFHHDVVSTVFLMTLAGFPTATER